MGSKGKRRFKGPQVPQSKARQLEDLQSQMAEAEAALAETSVTASAGGGMVTVEMSGTQQLLSIKIKPEAVDPDDVEMLEDLIMAAFEEAQDRSQRILSDKFGPVTGGLDLGGLL